jgi:hypothetical protein
MIRGGCKALARAGLAALVIAGTMGAAQAQGEPATIKRATELRDGPGESAKVLAPLAAQTQVQRLTERQGPWVKVATGSGPSGWVHMFDLGPASGTAGSIASGGAGMLRAVTGLFSKRGTTPITTPTATVGIRGLSAEDLASAQPNMPAVTQMEALRQSEDQARRFAQSSSLAALRVPDLPSTPKPGSAPASGNTESAQ